MAKTETKPQSIRVVQETYDEIDGRIRQALDTSFDELAASDPEAAFQLFLACAPSPVAEVIETEPHDLDVTVVEVPPFRDILRADVERRQKTSRLARLLLKLIPETEPANPLKEIPIRLA